MNSLNIEKIIGEKLYLNSNSKDNILFLKINNAKGKEMCSLSKDNVSYNKGLIGYWPFDTRNSTHVFDKSGHKNSGIIIDGVSFSKGKYGDAASFDGINDNIRVPTFNYDEISISAWFYRESNDNSRADAIFGG